MRYIIIGAGAVGGTIGACLHQSGHDVVLVARGDHLRALREAGLTLATPAGTEVLPIPAAGGPDEVRPRPGDVLIVSVKSQDTAGVLEQWAWHPVSDGTAAAETLPVVCAQNGVANEAVALRRFRRVYGMCVWLPATHLAPGRVDAQGTPLAGLLPVGRYPRGTDDFTERIAATLSASRFLAPVSDDVMRWKYGKLLANLHNATEALCFPEARGGEGAWNGEDARELRKRARAEALAVFDAAGIGYASPDEIRAARADQVEIGTVDGAERGGGSSWQSLTRGTGTIEADYLNGEITLLGRWHGVPVPVNAALQRLANAAAREGRAPGSMTPAAILSAAGVSGS